MTLPVEMYRNQSSIDNLARLGSGVFAAVPHLFNQPDQRSFSNDRAVFRGASYARRQENTNGQ